MASNGILTTVLGEMKHNRLGSIISKPWNPHRIAEPRRSMATMQRRRTRRTGSSSKAECNSLIGMQAGFIDICLQSHVAGWAVDNGRAASLTVEINGVPVGRADPNVIRPELAHHGVPPDAGFMFYFDGPLIAEDTVGLRFANGEHIPGSPTQRHSERLHLLNYGIGGEGLEFGPLDRPLFSKTKYAVSYVDHDTTEGLRNKYAHVSDPSLVRPDHLTTIDFVWSGRLSDVVGGRKFSWAVACGVVEHVADTIGWLQQIAEILVPGGILNLEVPDARVTFDHRRHLTTVAELIEDHERKLERPSIRQIYDHISRVTAIGSPELSLRDQMATSQNAYGVAKAAAASQTYVDVHCHVWTRESWMECWHEIGWLGLFPFKIAAMSQTFPDTRQFIVSLLND